MPTITKDKELKGFAQVYSSVQELIESAEANDPKETCPYGYGSWGESFSGWKGVRNRWNNPWQEGLDKLRLISNEIMESQPPKPVSIRRQRRWSESDGEVDVDRALAGEYDFMKQSFRLKRPRVKNVTILQNVGAIAIVSSSDLFWRSAACIIAIDLLEESGYSCEFWAYTNGNSRHYDPQYPHNFSAVCLKQ